jgi:hypothetical protein
MPRSLWVIEVLQPKVRGEGREWYPTSFEQTKREAEGMATETRRSLSFYESPPVKVRVRRWAPVGSGK